MRSRRFLPDNPELEVCSSADLERRTCKLFFALAEVAITGDAEYVHPLRDRQREYVQQYRTTAGHVMSLTGNLANVRTFVSRNRKMRHAALYQAVAERLPIPSWRQPIRPSEERLYTFGKRLESLHSGSDLAIPRHLQLVAPLSKWSEPLDGYQIYNAAAYLGEHVADDIVLEDQRFLRVALPGLDEIALTDPVFMLRSDVA